MQGARIIVVDDEAAICAAYAKILAAEGHQVRTACDVFACRAALNDAPADIVVLDLGLPGVDGLTFAAELQDERGIGVLVVTSRSDVNTRITALSEGADDYLVKPVHPGELSARVFSLMRRLARTRGGRYRFGGWTIDLERRVVMDRDERLVATTRGEFELLSRLIEARGKIVSREVLSDAVGRGADSDVRSVDALVSRIRRKLGDDGEAQPVIVTSPGFGYRLGRSAELL